MNFKVFSGILLASSLLLTACGGTEEKEATNVDEKETTETAEKVTTEAPAEETESEEKKNDDTAILTSDGLDETLTLDTVKLDVEEARTFKVEADQEMAIFADVEVGEELQGLVIKYSVENTSDEPKNFYLDQAEVLTDTGEQLSPAMMLTGGNFKADMMGKVKSTLEIPYFFKDSKADEIKNVKIEIPAVVHPEEYSNLSEPQTVTIDFK